MNLLPALLAAGSTPTTTAAPSKSTGSFFDIFTHPIAWLLAQIYAVVPNYGIAIMVLSVVWMLLISPLTLKSTRSMLAMQKLQPELKRLQAEHKDDRQAFAQAQMELFREHNVSPFGSCLPMLLPLPVFFALFRVISGLSRTINGVPAPRYLSHTSRMYQDIFHAHGKLVAFGMDLAKNAFSPHSSVLAAAPFWILLVIMGATSYLQSAQMLSRNPANQNNPQARMMKYLPLIFVLFCLRFPAGVVLYYAMSNICRIIQQDAMYRFDPKVKALVAQEVDEVEDKTHRIEDEHRRGPGYTPPRSALGAAAGGERPARGSRFRDLLAAAAEQQQKAREQSAKDKAAPPPRAGGPGRSPTAGSPPPARNGNGNAARPAASSNNGGGAGGGANRPSNARRNRKRRRR